MRPRLVPARTPLEKLKSESPDRIDLKLSPAGLAAAKAGMTRVVNGAAGTGTTAAMSHLIVAGKTGTATAAPLKIPRQDAQGRIITNNVLVPRTNSAGKIELVEVQRPEYEELVLGTHAHPNPRAPWYRGTGEAEDKRDHAWFIGFAPADDPKVAFAVMVEYGGSGGKTAGFVAKRILEACIEHGYLPAKTKREPAIANTN